ncbi:MAG: ATP-dependent Clp protease ATP-binding subunit, partial [Deltaproteobacteria bacterium]|nr:ATP-dependent Clp protease ATP-binding subunit [Deltaproteobacteria bacterium]
MKEIIARAADISAKNNNCLDTGYLLLAMITEHGTVAKLLKLQGLTETKIKNHLRDLNDEPSDLWLDVTKKAQHIADTFRVRDPSPLHLLAAVAGFKSSRAVGVFEKFNLDAMAIHTTALRCLTGITGEHNFEDARDTCPPVYRSEALPLAEELQTLSSSQAIEHPAPPRREYHQLGNSHKQATPQNGLRAKQLIEMGRELEQKQRKKRATQLTTRQAQPSPLQDGIASATPFEKEPPPTSVGPVRHILPIAQDFELLADQFPLLSSIGRNLSGEAHQGKLDEIIGRSREMERMTDILNKRRANSPCLVGPAGVGKTAIVEGLALKLSRGEAPELGDRVIIELRPADLLSGTSVRGALSERLGQLQKEVADSDGRVILFFDEIHALLCSNDGADAIQELKTALGRGELPCIAATTDEEYIQRIEVDPALARRFTPVEVNEPNESDAIRILEGVEPVYRSHHDVEFSTEALTAAVRLSMRYINERALPDKAIALLDLAGARARRGDKKKVEAADVAHILAEQLDVPIERLAANNYERLLNLEEELAQHIVGHRHVLAALGETLRRNAAGFRSGRPIGSFLFLGPTGVGKTETAKALADFLFPGGSAMVRLDMSEFSEAHAVARLIGAPPGYIGHEEGGQLTRAVRRRPYCLVLLDEVEKAHQDVLKVLLQILDDGRLTDGLGRTVTFENTVIVMTSNLGSNLRTHRRHVGFGAARKTEEMGDLTESILSSVREVMPPELWNRIDDPLVFQPLDRNEVALVASLMLKHISEQLHKEHDVMIQLGDGAIEALIAAGGYDPDLGARPMRRTIQRLVEGPVAHMVLSGDALAGDTVNVTGAGGDLLFEIEREDRKQIALTLP